MKQAALDKIKIGLIIACVAQALWIGLLLATPQENLALILMGIAFVGSIVAYIFGGGILTALKISFKAASVIGHIGWCCTPLPISIVSGLFLSAAGLVCGLSAFIIFPVVIIFCNFMKERKELKAAEDYLKCFTPVNKACTEGADN